MPSPRRPRCSACGSPTHSVGDCFYTWALDLVPCFYCGVVGHTPMTCLRFDPHLRVPAQCLQCGRMGHLNGWCHRRRSLSPDP